MRIDEILAKRNPAISFEFFPPKTDDGWAKLEQAIAELKPLGPSHVSVTYGAGGSTREKTVDLAAKIVNDFKLDTVAHLTCVNHTRSEVGVILDKLWDAGVQNILALRGDPPKGEIRDLPADDRFDYSTDLVKFIKAKHNFAVAVAGFPEGHPQCLNKTRDLEHLKAKQDAGACCVVTQLFFDNNDFLNFRENARRMGITIPIVAGVMPIQNLSQMKRFVGMCGAKIPHPLLTKLESIEHDADAVNRAGIDYCVRQCQDLLFHGVDGLHFYTLNKSPATIEIVKRLELPTAAAA